jgi:hypothetical protein
LLLTALINIPKDMNYFAKCKDKVPAGRLIFVLVAAILIGGFFTANNGRYPVSLTLFPCVPTIRTYEKIV